jgi:signal peptidase I
MGQLGHWGAAMFLATASYFFISRCVLQSVKVVGKSMAPTLQDADRYLLNRWLYSVRSPQPGEIVVIRDPADHGLSVKRIIAAPRDELFLKDGSVRVNGRRLDEPYLPEGTRTFPEGRLSEQTLRCGPEQYIVLGDNRRNSTDSRCYGPVSRRDILGRIFP